ncbi:stage V sporulation protein SpoVM [Viridibacillus sp. YIM B01967]|uniref:Stage V sporulation protein SpoVM n=1 Tax=Viridibacillus soli TaxID=2798301 RepID=A0ABS1H4V1_9BACL|nr:stage V sporulation protein SpoVM [Viridibacillus soli]MBK3494431.1 stage V sporulation protein SpoVM [Viridibacillus soli]
MKVYTFQLPKFVSGFARVCLQAFQKETSTTTTATAKSKQRKKKEKMPG